MEWINKALDIIAPGWVGSLIGLLSLVAAGFFYVLTRQRTSIAFAYCGDRLLGTTTANLPAEISVHYKGDNIPRLTRSILVLWNSGEKTIGGEDIVGSDPLRLSVGEDGQILSIGFLKLSRAVNDAAISSLDLRSQQAELAFGFLDSGDGMVIEILHTSENIKPIVQGTFRGLPKGMKDFGRVIRTNQPNRPRILRSKRVIAWAMLIFGLAMSYLGVFASAEAVDAFLFAKPAPGWLLCAFMGALYLPTGLFGLYTLRRKHPRSLHIEDLD